MSIALTQKRRELNQRKVAALALLAKLTELDEWPERLEALGKRPDALVNETFVRALVQDVVQAVALRGTLPKLVEQPGPAAEQAEDEPQEKGTGKPGKATVSKAEKGDESD
jgi:hypothetical protein